MKIHHQSTFERWPLEDQSVQAIITSPPYWGLRKYDIPDIVIGGSSKCEHDWLPKEVKFSGSTHRAQKKIDNGRIVAPSDVCRCGAWQGQYGLEPSIQEYVEHTLLWAKEAWRVLKDDGVMFLNLGDSYGTVSGNMGGSMTESKITNLGSINFKQSNINKHKCKLLIPHRVAIALSDSEWVLRNDIVWSKPNGMPEAVQDRFSTRFENIFMLTKQGKYYFNLDAIRVKNKGDKFRYDKGKNPGDIWDISTQPSPEKHYAMWPEKLVERMVLCSSKQGDAVIDPFCGSGTTLMVADRLNRNPMGIDAGYQDIQQRRLSGIQKELL